MLIKGVLPYVVTSLAAVSVPLWAAQAGQPSQPSQTGQASSQPSSKSTMSANPNQRAADLVNTVNQGEIQLGQLMQDRTQNEHVKDFAKMVTSDHQDAENKLQSVARQSNLNLQDVPALQKQDQALKDRIQNESGMQADKSYVAAEIRDHRTAIRDLQKLEPNVTDPQLKSYVSSTLPVLQKHLADAQKLQAQLGTGASASH